MAKKKTRTTKTKTKNKNSKKKVQKAARKTLHAKSAKSAKPAKSGKSSKPSKSVKSAKATSKVTSKAKATTPRATAPGTKQAKSATPSGLIARGVILSEGMRAPDFELPTHTGEIIRLSDLRGQKVVLYFYPKDMTPGCTQQACDFQRELQQFEQSGVLVLGISRDDVRSHQKFAEKYGLQFKLLADETGEVSTKYGVLKEKNMYGRKSIGIERTTFVIDGDGVIRRVYNRVQVNGHIADVLNQVQEGVEGAGSDSSDASSAV